MDFYKLLKIAFSIIILSTSLVSYGDSNIERTIHQQLRKLNNNAVIGIKIRNLRTGKVIYEKNAKKHFIFASAFKFISIAALLEYFSPNYFFSTTIFKKGDDYYLDINDPDFSTEDLEDLIQEIKINGVTSINGNFYIIDKAFILPPITEGSMESDRFYCYGAPITKAHVDKNCVKILVEAASKVKEKINIENQSLVPYNVTNNAVTVPDNVSDKIKANIQDNHIVIEGTLNKATGKVSIGVVVIDNLNHIRLTLAKILSNNNISITGNILYHKDVTPVKHIAIRNKSIVEITKKILKNSDNYLADYLLANFSTMHGLDSWKQASNLLKQLVKEKLHIDLSDAEIIDASGLSRYNRLTINHFDAFLTTIYHSIKWRNTLSMLAIPGEKGTLEKRMEGLTVFAKTGTMSGVSSLVGYAFDSKNTPYSFVIVTNNYVGSKNLYAALEDRIIRAITNH